MLLERGKPARIGTGIIRCSRSLVGYRCSSRVHTEPMALSFAIIDSDAPFKPPFTWC